MDLPLPSFCTEVAPSALLAIPIFRFHLVCILPNVQFLPKPSDLCPSSRLRESFGLDASTYMLSLCSDTSLRHLTSPGKSGSVFFLSQVVTVVRGRGEPGERRSFPAGHE